MRYRQSGKENSYKIEFRYYAHGLDSLAHLKALPALPARLPACPPARLTTA